MLSDDGLPNTEHFDDTNPIADSDRFRNKISVVREDSGSLEVIDEGAHDSEEEEQEEEIDEPENETRHAILPGLIPGLDLDKIQSACRITEGPNSPKHYPRGEPDEVLSPELLVDGWGVEEPLQMREP